jgi:hypothetical protein
MEKIKLEVEVTKELHEVGVAAAALVNAAIVLKKEGAEMDKIVAQVMALFPKLMDAVGGLDQIDDELKAHPAEAALGLALPVLEVLSNLLEKKPLEEVV